MIYLMRHGQTDWNKEYRIQGQTDTLLNENGRNMAIEAAKKYENRKFDVCFASPLKRAMETAQLFLAGKDTPIIPDERIREMTFGSYEGSRRVMEHPDHPLYDFFVNPAQYVSSGGAESIEEMMERAGAFIADRLKPCLQDKNVLIVAHGAIGLAIINTLEGIPKDRFWDRMMKNCELVEIHPQESWLQR